MVWYKPSTWRKKKEPTPTPSTPSTRLMTTREGVKTEAEVYGTPTTRIFKGGGGASTPSTRLMTTREGVKTEAEVYGTPTTLPTPAAPTQKTIFQQIAGAEKKVSERIPTFKELQESTLGIKAKPFGYSRWTESRKKRYMEHIEWATKTAEKESKHPFPSFIRGYGEKIYGEAREHPLKYGTLFGLSLGIGTVVGGGIVTATAIHPIAGSIATGTVTGAGLFLGGTYAYGVSKEIKSAKTWEQKGGVLGVTTLEVGTMGLGYAKGAKLFGKIGGLWRTKTLSESKILTRSVGELKTTFPEAGKGLAPSKRAELHKSIFEKGEYADIFKGTGEVAPGYHMAAKPIKGTDVTRALHISTQPSPQFLDISGGKYKLLPSLKDLFKTPGKPTGYAITPTGGYKSVVGYEVTRGTYKWTKPVTGTLGLEPTGTTAYFKYKGVRIPVHGMKGKGTAYVPGTKPEIQAVFEVGGKLPTPSTKVSIPSSVIELPSYPIISPSSLAVSYGISKPSTVTSYKPSTVTSYKPSTVTSYKPSTVTSYKPSYKFPSPSSYKSIIDSSSYFPTRKKKIKGLPKMPEGRKYKKKKKGKKPARKTIYVPTLTAQEYEITSIKIPKSYKLGAGGLGGRPKIVKKQKKKVKKKTKKKKKGGKK